MATWDDHDFCQNNYGASCPLYNGVDFRPISQKNFLHNLNIPNNEDPRHSTQEGVYTSNIFAESQTERTHVITLDARYHRSPTYTSYGGCEGVESTMLGDAQWTWLRGEFNRKSEVKVIASGIQVLPPVVAEDLTCCARSDSASRLAFEAAVASLGETGLQGTHYESWAEIPWERELLLRLAQQSLNDGNARAIVFVSGDQHWGELMRKELPAHADFGDAQFVFEITSSGIGQSYDVSGDFINDNRMPLAKADTQNDGSYTRDCVFPFIYDGIQHSTRTMNDESRPWCSLETDSQHHHIDGEWGYCSVNADYSEDGVYTKDCVFPFRYGGVLYTECTMTGHNKPWCSLETDGDDNHVTGEWGNCAHLINDAPSNYGEIQVDFAAENVKLILRTQQESGAAFDNTAEVTVPFTKSDSTPTVLPTSSASPTSPTTSPSNSPTHAPTDAPTTTPTSGIQLPTSQQALNAIFASLNGDSWFSNNNWGGSDGPCTNDWYGVDCKDGEVVKLKLHENNLDGSIPTQERVEAEWK